MMFISVHFFPWWVLFTFIDSLVVWQFLGHGNFEGESQHRLGALLRVSYEDQLVTACEALVARKSTTCDPSCRWRTCFMWILQSSQAYFIDRRQDECHVRNSSRSKPQGRAEWLGGGLGRQAFLAENQLHFQAYPPLPELSELAADANATAIELVPYHISDS